MPFREIIDVYFETQENTNKFCRTNSKLFIAGAVVSYNSFQTLKVWCNIELLIITSQINTLLITYNWLHFQTIVYTEHCEAGGVSALWSSSENFKNHESEKCSVILGSKSEFHWFRNEMRRWVNVSADKWMALLRTREEQKPIECTGPTWQNKSVLFPLGK